MKTLPKGSLLLALLTIFIFSVDGNAQILKKLGKRAERAAERTIERRVEKETSEKTDEVLDSILEPGKKGKQAPQNPNPPNPTGDGQESTSTGSSGNMGNTDTPTSGPKTLAVYSKFDFVPGDKTLFFDDFSNDFIGDFPSKWNTNGGGEVVTVDGSDEKWLSVNSGSYMTLVPSPKLPEDFTIELDLKFINLSRKTSSTGGLDLILSETNNLNNRETFAQVNLNPCQFIDIGPEAYNRFPDDPDPIRNRMKIDIREVFNENMHVSIAVNKNRYRIWINERKIFDLPQFIKNPSLINHFKIHMDGLSAEKGERLLITNVKIAEGGVDLRRKLLAEGKISTNGILFDSGSDNLKPESMGIIRQIYQVLQQDTSINLQIVGHTDSDGNDESNMKLSKDRADAVKNALVSIYGVSTERLTTEGKGESEPVGDNSTVEGKAQNRRVEFIKQ